MLMTRTLPAAEFQYALRMVGEVRDPRTPPGRRSRLVDELAALTGCHVIAELIHWHEADLTDRQLLNEALASR
jgi:hypothetical protein